ncbi:MAG: 6-hydroxymethylpterin diphosphokinase MptE-like protein [Promethearchaeota archaeon]
MDIKLKDQIDFYNEFKECYFKIIDDFQFNYREDCRARDYLSSIFYKKPIEWKLENVLHLFREKIISRLSILVYGCGPSLEKTVNALIKKKGVKLFENFINLAADGASILLKEKKIKIDAIITDLDGITKQEFKYTDFVIVHAHGNNIENLKFFSKQILDFKNIIGTTQVKPVPNLINPGGFTDGDRILYFIRSLLNPFQKVYLIGMDFGEIIGKYSKLTIKTNQKANQIKIKKLNYAIKLIKWIEKAFKNEIYFVNSNYLTENFKNLSIEEFLK